MKHNVDAGITGKNLFNKLLESLNVLYSDKRWIVVGSPVVVFEERVYEMQSKCTTVAVPVENMVDIEEAIISSLVKELAALSNGALLYLVEIVHRVMTEDGNIVTFVKIRYSPLVDK